MSGRVGAMTRGDAGNKLHLCFTIVCENGVARVEISVPKRVDDVAILAMFLFVALFALGKQYFGWEDPNNHIQFALVISFIFGVVFGYRVKD